MLLITLALRNSNKDHLKRSSYATTLLVQKDLEEYEKNGK